MLSADSTQSPHARLDFLLGVLPIAAAGVAFRWYVPLWDGEYYLRCLETALGPRHGAGFLFCANHPTGGYFAPLALVFHLSGMRYAAVIAANVLLGALAAHAAADLSALMFPGAIHRAERALVTLAFGLCPLLLACTLQLTPDLGVALFSLLAVRALARHRIVSAAFFGALASFSKETGAAMYVLACAAHLLVHVAWAPGTPAEKAAALRRHAPLLLVPALGAAWFVARKLLRGQLATWQGVGSQYALWRHVMSVSLFDDVLPTQLAEIFVLNFAWVISVFILLSAVEPAWRFVLRDPAPADDTPEQRTRVFFTLVFVGVVVAVTRFRTLVIPRYMLPAVVLLPLMAQRALHSLKVAARLRLLLLGAFAALSLLAAFRTRDAVAMGLFGTFEFGERRVLDLAARAHDIDGRREHMVYNLEFTRLARLLDEALPWALADGSHDLAFSRNASLNTIGYVDRRTHRRAASARGAVVPRSWPLEEIRRTPTRPPRLYYVELPGMDDDDELILWGHYYRVGPPTRFAHDGYAIAVRELTLLDRPVGPPP